MKNPQLENGYTRIANEILRALCRYRISGEEWQVLLTIWVKTYGWHKASDKISLSQFVDMTGLAKSSVQRALKKLTRRGVTKKLPTIPVTYSFIKHYGNWRGATKLYRGLQFSKQGGYNLVNQGATNLRHTKDTLTKDTLTKDIIRSQIKDLLALFPKDIQNLIEEYIETSEKENKSGKILETKRLRLINELYNFFLQAELIKFKQALEITVKNQAPNINYVKKVYKNMEKKIQVGLQTKTEKDKKEWENGVKRGKEATERTRKYLDSYK